LSRLPTIFDRITAHPEVGLFGVKLPGYAQPVEMEPRELEVRFKEGAIQLKIPRSATTQCDVLSTTGFRQCSFDGTVIACRPSVFYLSTEHTGQWEGGERNPTSSFAGRQMPPGLHSLCNGHVRINGGLDARKNYSACRFGPTSE
jgi:hypothetical protein